MGSLKALKDGTQEVQKDFYLATAADIVADPSAPDAYVNGVMEGKEWIWDNGILQEKVIADHKETIERANRKNLEVLKIKVFEDFLKKL